MKKINLILLIIWMIFIFVFSNQPSEQSDKTSNGLISGTVKIVCNILNKDISEERLNQIIDDSVYFVRKSAHVFEYLILGILILNVLKDCYDINKRVIIISLILSTIYACTDEIHQLFVIGRSGQVKDVLIDFIGSCIGVFGFNKFYLKRRLK